MGIYMKANLVEKSLVAGRIDHRVIEKGRCVDIEVPKNHGGGVVSWSILWSSCSRLRLVMSSPTPLVRLSTSIYFSSWLTLLSR